MKMADLLGESPNLFDEIFSEFENWKMILNSLGEFPEKEGEQSRHAINID